MKILVTGGGGQLAKSYEKSTNNHKLFLFDKNSLDITNKLEVFSRFKEVNPDIVMHFASLTRGEVCAKNNQLAHDINVSGTGNIAQACKEYDSTLLFISTNEVFSGKKKTPYIETDEAIPSSTAGKTKLLAEKLIKSNLEKYFIVRTMWLYSNWSNNFLQNILDIAKEKNEVSVVTDEVGSPTNSLDLADALNKLIATKKYGIYHIANKGAVSRFEFAKKAISFLKLNKVKINSVLLKDFDRLEYPPKYSPLLSIKNDSVGIKMRNWENALEDFLNNYMEDHE